MRGKVSIFLMVGFVVSLCATTTLAQVEEQKATLFLFWDVLVNPSKVVEYEAATKEEVALYSKHKFPYPWSSASTDDFHYYFLIPVDKFADIDNIYKALNETQRKMGAEYQALMKRFSGTYEYIHMYMWYLNHDLSYTPENPRLKVEEEKNIYYTYLYFKPGMEKEAEEIAKKWKALYKSKNISDRYYLWVGDIGTDMPVYCVLGGGKSAADFFSQAEKNDKLLGEEAMALWEKTLKLCRKIEQKTGRPRPDLSLIPFSEREK
ncbi:MAG: hypothetical protein V3T89_00215 [bacterium]